MVRYFFHLRDGDILYDDPDGAEFPSIDDAVAEAFASARDLLAERLRQGIVLDGQILEITDEAGQICALVALKDAFKLPDDR